MGLTAWVLTLLAVWFVAGLGVALVLGHVLRRRDRPARVRGAGRRAIHRPAAQLRRRRSA